MNIPRPVEFGFVAALNREVSGIVRGWQSTNVEVSGVENTIYSEEDAVLICAGTGVERAGAAARVLVEKCSPRVLVSIGFAGSCTERLRPGAVVVPSTVLEADSGRAFQCAFGSGQLITLDRVAGRALKQESALRFAARAVDMEAAGVAAVAAAYNREFAAIKAISDGVNDDLGFLSSFVTPAGFDTGRFVAYIAIRPRLWGKVAALGRNSKIATASLEDAVRECRKNWRSFSAKHSEAAAQV